MDRLLKILTFSFLLFFGSSFTPPDNGSLIIDIQNINGGTGIIWIGIYDSADNYLVKEKAILKEVKINAAGPKKIQIEDLPYGNYAVALFHDLNENGEMDRDWLGIPSEPFAFSGQPTSRFRLPRFEEVKFTFSPGSATLTTHLQRWWD
jgi:uncharacterized protein (DUF2141 family)